MAHHRALGHRFKQAQIYLLGRVMRQWALHALTGAPLGPSSWRFVTDALGAPQAVGQTHLTRSIPVAVSLAHTGNQIVVAAGRCQALGVDMERTDRYALRSHLPEAIAQRHFTASEIARIKRQPAQVRDQAFVRQWALKEAALKAWGIGLRGAWGDVAPSVPLAGAIPSTRWGEHKLFPQNGPAKLMYPPLWCGLLSEAVRPGYTLAVACGTQNKPTIKLWTPSGSAYSLL
jgi:phosphopantetheine--protein transferase-like protein